MWTTIRNGVTALAVALALTGCDTGTGPADPTGFDAEGALEDYEVLASVLESSELAALGGLSGRTPFVSPARTDGPHAGPVISGFRRGTTFVYDPTSGEYRPDPDRSGAPSNGVRFILYEQAADGTPQLGGEVGYADLLDEGDGSAEDVALRVRVVREEEAVLDYLTTVDWAPGRAAITAEGFVQGDRGRLDFDVKLRGSDGNGLRESELLFDLAVDSRSLSVTGRVQGTDEGDDDMGEVELEILHGSNVLGVTTSGENGVLDGSVAVNGEPFAVFQGPEGDLDITAPDGSALTWAEGLALQRAVDVVEDVFDLVEDLLDPVDEIVLLGIIL